MVLFFFALCTAVLTVPSGAIDTLQVTSPDPMLEQWRWTAFDDRDGLAGGVVDLFEDRQGHIWLATVQGAQRYDGYRWTTYTTEEGLAGNLVSTIVQSQDGSLWFGTFRSGISRYDGERWTTYTTADGLASNSIVSIVEGLHSARDGTLWAGFGSLGDTTGTSGGISRFDGETWTTIAVPGLDRRPVVSRIHQAADGSVWFTTRTQGVLRFDGVNWQQYTTEEGLAGNSVFAMLEARDGTLWFACINKGISRFDGHQWRTYTHGDGLPANIALFTLWQTEDGTIWAGGVRNSVGVFCRLAGEEWKVYASEDFPLFDGFVDGKPSRDGTVWLYLKWRAQVYHFDPKGLATVYSFPDSLYGGYTTEDGSSWFHTGMVRGLESDKRLAMSSAVRDRAVRYKDGLWTGYEAADGFLEGAVFGMEQTSDGSLWFFGTHQGQDAVARYDGVEWRRYTPQDGLIDRLYIPGSRGHAHPALLEARDGALWFVGQHEGKAAVCRYDGHTWRRYTPADSLGGDVYAILAYEATDGTLWFAMEDESGNLSDADAGRGLFRYDGETWTHYTEKDGLSSGYITGMAEWPAATLWVGTEAGLSRLELSAAADSATWWNKTDLPMSRPKVRSLVSTPSDLWFAFLPNRRGGVVRYDGETWQGYRVDQKGDALVGNKVNQILPAADGALWFVAQEGLSRFDGEGWLSYSAEVGAPFEWLFPEIRPLPDGSFWLDGSDGKVVHFRFGLDPTEPETFVEAAVGQVSSAGNVRLRWSGRDKWDRTPPRKLRYQWRLDGGEWSSWLGRSERIFTGLRSGKHQFEVRSRNQNGKVDPTPAVHGFVVEAPWWRNPWLIGLVVALGGLVLVQTARVVRRGRRLEQSNKALQTTLEEKEQAQDALVRSESMAAIGTLVSGAAHELNNPIGAAASLVQSVEEMAQEDSTEAWAEDRALIVEHLSFSRKELERVRNIVASLLDLSRQSQDYTEAVDLQTVAQDALWGLHGRYDTELVSIEEEYQTDLPRLQGNFAQLVQVALNLVNNAVDALGSGAGTVTLKTYAAAGQVVFECRDSGSGISDEVRQDIFKPFFTTKAPGGGTGLGLYVCHQIVERHGGSIAVESIEGQGTTVRVRLPQATEGGD